MAGLPIAAAAGAIAVAQRPAFATGGAVQPSPMLFGEHGAETIVTVDCPGVMSADQMRRMSKLMHQIAEADIHGYRMRRG